jgi:FAD/FMN-containing dehydrogenase
MQSNNDFGVASTFCVNAHGWPVPHGPFGSTVRALRMLLADGSLVTCSREENAELFAHAMGGYGLFGIIVDLDVEMTPNLLLAPTTSTMPAERFGHAFIKIVSDRRAEDAGGRVQPALPRRLRRLPSAGAVVSIPLQTGTHALLARDAVGAGFARAQRGATRCPEPGIRG